MPSTPTAAPVGPVASGTLKIRDTAVVVYSRNGHSQRLARQVADQLDADIFLIRTKRYRLPVLGLVQAVHDAVRGRLPEVCCNVEAVSRYRCLVVGGPIWAGNIAPPVSAFLAAQQDLPAELGLFVTCGGMNAPETAFLSAEARMGRRFSATMWLPNTLEDTDEMTRRLAAFRSALLPSETAAEAPV
ncbi:MAG: hypothetical protein JXR14_04020 [Paracoccaceae bacterium]